MTVLRLNTCECEVEYQNAPPHNLIQYISKCPYHNTQTDILAWEEIKTVHSKKALVMSEIRQFLYGTKINPEKYGLGPDVDVTFDNTANTRRLLIGLDTQIQLNNLTPGERNKFINSVKDIILGSGVKIVFNGIEIS